VGRGGEGGQEGEGAGLGGEEDAGGVGGISMGGGEEGEGGGEVAGVEGCVVEEVVAGEGFGVCGVVVRLRSREKASKG